MVDSHEPDMSCVPYRRKLLYLSLTVPFMALLVTTGVVLWTVSKGAAIAMAGCYLGMCLFQAFCCAYQRCPYIGRFCPAIAGIIPANLIAWLLFRNRTVRSRFWFHANAVLAILCWLGIAIIPVYWLGRIGTWYAAGYVLAHVVYAIIFVLTICPTCAIRRTCPGGRSGGMLCGRRTADR